MDGQLENSRLHAFSFVVVEREYMNYYYDEILKTAKYIENNLTADISIQKVANNAGFSEYHFMRIFKAVSGHTINNYIKRRKITEAARVLLESDMRIIDIAVLYGYNSQEAFTRAFKEVYNVAPHTYRINKMPYDNVGQIILNENILNMKNMAALPVEPKIIYKDDFLIGGMKYIGKNQNFEVPKLWNHLKHKTEYLAHRINEDICYGYESYNEDLDKSGCFEYIAGFEVEDSLDIPDGMKLKRVTASKYAVFPIPSIVESFPKHIGQIYSIHLPSSGLKPIGNYDFEYYDCSFDPNNENSFVSFYIPVL